MAGIMFWELGQDAVDPAHSLVVAAGKAVAH